MNVDGRAPSGSRSLAIVKDQMQPLPTAANASDLPKVQSILASGEFTQHDLDLALARAVLRFKERAEIARVLLDHGANPDGQYGSNYGPIIFVTGETLDSGGLQFLIDAGADVTFAPIETKYGRQCPMSYFLGSGVRGKNADKHRGIEILLQNDAFVPPEITPAMMAIHRGDVKLLGKLLDENPSLVSQRFAEMPYGNISLRGATLLHAAVEFDELECCTELLQRGACADATAEVVDGKGGQTPVFHAVFNARHNMLMKLLESGAELDIVDCENNTPLWHLCKSWATDTDRIAIARLIIEHGATIRRACENQSTALHQAAGQGPIEMVELLLRNGAKEWQTDKDGKRPIDCARAKTAADKQAIIELLDRPVIRDPVFKSAVQTVHAGDLVTLQSILHGHPNLVHQRAIEPDCYPPSYFSNPKLIWFVANNPTLMQAMPANITQICETFIAADSESADLDYTLELVMTSESARKQGHQLSLMKMLLSHGAKPGDLLTVLAHCVLEPIKVLIEMGCEMTAPMAAALGENDRLIQFLAKADPATRQNAFGIAVINRQHTAARLCLTAGADVNASLPVHVHSLPAHQAAVNDDVPMLQLLVEFNARLDIRDTLWNSTPLGWAVHTGKQTAEKYLRSISAS
jgi:ankyrin repeat protein